MALSSHPTVVLAAPTWSLNGPNIFSANLTRGLIVREIPAHIVLTRPDWSDGKPLPIPADVPFQELPVSRFMPLSARWRAMTRHLEKHAPCIYIPNHDFGHSCISPSLPDCIAIVGVVHSDDPQHYEHARRLGDSWNAVTAVSPRIAREISRIAPSLVPRLSMIPYGVNAAAVFPVRSRAAGRRLRVIYAGRLDQPQKRVLDLPEILRAAAGIGVPIQITIAGEGPAKTELRSRFDAACATARVDFVGTVDSAALAALFAHHDVVILLSQFEGLPIGLLEAMGQGCIPLVTDLRSGIPELVEDGKNGFRVPVGDVGAFACRLAQLFHNPAERLLMAQAAHRTVRVGRYRLDRMVQEYVKLFATLQNRARTAAFRRHPNDIMPSPSLPWQEHLPSLVQRFGHYGKQLLARERS